jgi:CSLREA domain-containing protein
MHSLLSHSLLFLRTSGLMFVVGMALAAALSMTARPAYAATFVVTKTADTADGTCDADCSLREAIVAANAAAGADDITLPAGVYTLSLTGAVEDASLTGDLDISDDLTINGAAAATTVIDGNASDRVLHVHAGNVTIDNVTIRNGDALNNLGGGVKNNGVLVINSSVITDNIASNGGGIHNGLYRLLDSNTPGGPTYSFTDISGTGTALNLGSGGNTVVTLGFDFTYYGQSYGDVYVDANGYLSFVDKEGFDGSSCCNSYLVAEDDLYNSIAGFWDDLDQDSGNVYWQTEGSAPNRRFIVQYDDVTVDSTPFTFQIILSETSNEILLQYADVNTNNATQGETATVGVVGPEDKWDAAQYSYNQVVLSDNLAIRFFLAAGDLTLDGVTLGTNEALSHGGALYNNSIALVRNNSMISANTSEGNGSGLSNRGGVLTVADSTVADNVNCGGNCSGAGIANLFGLATIQDSTVSGNQKNDDGSGAGLFNMQGVMKIVGSTITGNSSSETGNTSGAGVLTLFGALTITNSTVSNNTVLDGNSGAGVQAIHSQLTIVDSTIEGNSGGDESTGAGVDAIKSTVVISGSTVANNTINSTDAVFDSAGAGIRADQSVLSIVNSTISSNTNTAADGGGLAHFAPPSYVVRDSNDPDGPTYSFIDISGSGASVKAALSPDQNDGATVQNIGFDFVFYGQTFTQTYVSSNGYLNFDNGNANDFDPTVGSNECDNSNDSPNLAIFAFWDDLDPGLGGDIFVETRGSAPNRQFIVQYEDVRFDSGSETITFQVILYETNNQIKVQLADVEQSGRASGNSASIAVESADLAPGSSGDNYPEFSSDVEDTWYSSCDTESLRFKNNTAILFTPSGDLQITNSTISGNSAGADGGGVYYYGYAEGGSQASLINVTLANNSAAGGALANVYSAGAVGITNTIIANSSGGSCLNLGTLFGIDNLVDDITCINGSNVPGWLGAVTNLVASLANNGGSTLTHALMAGSNAIDAATTCVDAEGNPLTRDQIATLRPQGVRCDVGALEYLVSPGTLVVQKIVAGSPPAEPWQFNGPTGVFTLPAAGGSVVFTDVVAGPVGVTETVKPGFTVTSACSDGSENGGSLTVVNAANGPIATGGASIGVTLGAGQTITCTFTNTRTAVNITIVKDAEPPSSTNFRFTGSYLGGGSGSDSGASIADFYLDNPASDDGDAYSDKKVFTVPTGAVYSFAEPAVSGWYLMSIICNPAGSATVNLATRSVTINTSSGQDVVCTFRNEQAGVLNVRKYREVNGVLGQQAPEAFLSTWTIRVMTAPTNTLVTQAATNALGKVSFSLKPGSYTVCEVMKSGWRHWRNPTNLCFPVTLVAGGVTAQDFGNCLTSSCPAAPPVAADEPAEPGTLTLSPDEITAWVDAWLQTPDGPVEETLEPDITEEGDAGLRVFLPLIGGQ